MVKRFRNERKKLEEKILSQTVGLGGRGTKKKARIEQWVREKGKLQHSGRKQITASP